MAASNTTEAMKECRGRTIVGVLVAALPVHRPDLARGTRTFVFDDSTGFTFNDNGAFWQESAEEVQRAIDLKLAALGEAQETYDTILEMAGARRGAINRDRGE